MTKLKTIEGRAEVVLPALKDTTLVILPMTLDRIGKEVEDDDERPISIDSVDSAFKKFSNL